jgi:hypothetical protein
MNGARTMERWGDGEMGRPTGIVSPHLPISPSPHPSESSLPDLSPRTYRIAIFVVIVVFLGIWLGNFRWIYGWQLDDYHFYVLGRDTIKDPKAAFAPAENLFCLYFYLYAYLPIKSGIHVPSYDLPALGADTGNFRFFLLYTIFFHAAIVLLWSWFAVRTCGNRLAALISVLLLVTSLEFVIWTPEPETRFAGFPFALIAIWLLLARPAGSREQGARRALAPRSLLPVRYFLAGSLIGMSQMTNYTALYLAVPVCAAVCLADLWHRRLAGRALVEWGAFLLGTAWPHASRELIAHYCVGLPWSECPTMSTFRHNANHWSVHSFCDQLCIWRDNLTSMIGIPLLLAAAVGAWLFARSSFAETGIEATKRKALVAGVVLGIALLFVKPTIPVSRQISNLEPFLLLFAGVAVVYAVARLRARRWLQGAACAAILVALDTLPVYRSYEAFQAHLSLGRTIEWAYQNRGHRAIRWLTPAKPFEYTPDDLLRDDPENWVITYKPEATLALYPEVFHALEVTVPLRREPNIWATHWFHMSHIAHVDFTMRSVPSASEARVYRVGDLAAVMRPPKHLAVESVTADSCQNRWTEAGNVFDHDGSPDSNMYWISSDAPGPHSLEIVLKQPETLGELHVVEPYYFVPRISKLEIQAAAEKSGPYETIWQGADLHLAPIIRAQWAPRQIARLKIIAAEPRTLHHASNTVRIDEVIFPGYFAEGPPLTRAFPPMRLTGIRREAGELVATGENISRNAVLVLDGAPLAGDGRAVPISDKSGFALAYRTIYWNALRAELPTETDGSKCWREVHLTDPYRRSNSLWIDFPECEVSRVPPDRQGIREAMRPKL